MYLEQNVQTGANILQSLQTIYTGSDLDCSPGPAWGPAAAASGPQQRQLLSPSGRRCLQASLPSRCLLGIAAPEQGKAPFSFWKYRRHPATINMTLRSISANMKSILWCIYCFWSRLLGDLLNQFGNVLDWRIQQIMTIQGIVTCLLRLRHDVRKSIARENNWQMMDQSHQTDNSLIQMKEWHILQYII